MFKTKRELRGLIRASRKSLLEAEDKITQRNKMIKMQQKENEELYTENKTIQKDFEEAIEIIKDIKFLSESTTYNNDKARLGKIKELAQDYLETC